MQIVIEIDNELYQMCKDLHGDADPVESAIANGTPLPKGHGRLIDADAFISALEDASKRQKYKELLIGDCLTVDDVFKAVIESLQNRGLAEGDAPTIIEADTESEEQDTDGRK